MKSPLCETRNVLILFLEGMDLSRLDLDTAPRQRNQPSPCQYPSTFLQNQNLQKDKQRVSHRVELQVPCATSYVQQKKVAKRKRCRKKMKKQCNKRKSEQVGSTIQL